MINGNAGRSERENNSLRRVINASSLKKVKNIINYQVIFYSIYLTVESDN
jgi:hypothetical protein